MGFNKIYLEEINNLNLNLKNLNLLELGDQEIHDNSIGFFGQKLRSSNIFKPLSYTVYDLNKQDGVINFDLSIRHDKYEKFDIITNFGTTEHVELEEGQYNCWYNIHNLLNVNGTIISIVPCDNGFWEKHCRYYYTYNFFKNFENYGYELKKYKITLDGNCLAVLTKNKNINFMPGNIFWKNIVFKNYSSEIIHESNNPKKLKF